MKKEEEINKQNSKTKLKELLELDNYGALFTEEEVGGIGKMIPYLIVILDIAIIIILFIKK